MLIWCFGLQQNAALKFRAGVRRPAKAPLITEYQAHFTWEQPTPPLSQVRGAKQGSCRSSSGGRHTQEVTPTGREREGEGEGMSTVVTKSHCHCRSRADQFVTIGGW